ncbi:MAG: winged helix-turn-helix transcriptional regulator [Thaumarchaeota archaeon]|nr:winged helix-turn-helix transcriptional regulator [Nitrososphaerota archaeon]MDE1830938.1 winged helix-turn-helix transcriptional regulator [Nitrososphaerota archaeon]MDE1840415.1 winged helix-turn-helix transcriptional regulator [Nitrososphaerota archaeon]
MQVFPGKPAMLEDSERCDIFRLVGKHVQKILEAITDVPMSALEISKICNIGSSDVYHTLNKLSRCKLVKITGRIDMDGKKIHLYQNKIKSITMTQFRLLPCCNNILNSRILDCLV